MVGRRGKSEAGRKAGSFVGGVGGRRVNGGGTGSEEALGGLNPTDRCWTFFPFEFSDRLIPPVVFERYRPEILNGNENDKEDDEDDEAFCLSLTMLSIDSLGGGSSPFEGGVKSGEGKKALVDAGTPDRPRPAWCK